MEHQIRTKNMDENGWLEDDYHNKPFIYKDPY